MRTTSTILAICCCLSLSAATSAQPRFNPNDMVRHMRPVHAGPPSAGRAQLPDSGAFLLDTSVIYAPTYSEQSYPAIAFDGTNFLLVWRDHGHGGVYGTRVDRMGRVLDSAGIAVTSHAYGGQAPTVAFGGGCYLVVWAETRDDTNASVYAARVDPSGVVLDPDGIAVSTGPELQAYPAVASDGLDFLAVWTDRRNGEYDIYGARVSRSGVVLDPEGIAVSTAAGVQHKSSVGFDGRGFIAAWLDSRLGESWPKVYCARVSPAGAVLDPNGIALPSTAYDIWGTNVTSDGVNAFVTWTDRRSDTCEVYGARVSQSGSVLDTNGIAISGTTGLPQCPAAAFDESDYRVVWYGYQHGGSDCGVLSARVSRTGVVLDTNAIVISSSAACWPNSAVGFGDGKFLVAWADTRLHAADIFGARVTLAGAVLDPDGVLMSLSVNYQQTPALASDGTDFLAVWQDRRDSSGAHSIYGARVGQSGGVLDPTGFAISTDGDWYEPTVSCDGTNYLVVWDGERDSTYGIYGARVSPDGTVLDPDGIAISSAQASPEYPAVTFDGASYLVVWDDYRYDHVDPDICGARVSPEGVVLDTGGLIISAGEGYQLVPAAGFDGTNALVAWSEERNPGRLYCARVSASGVVLDTAGILVADSAFFPSFARGTTSTLLVWESYRNHPGNSDDIYCARVSSSGIVLDTVEIAVSTSPGWQGMPVAEFDGTDFLVAWGDVDGIHGARVSESGVVFDDGPIKRQARSQALACGASGRMLLACDVWTGIVGDKAYNAHRVWGMMDPNPGVEESPESQATSRRLEPTIIRGVLYLVGAASHMTQAACLMDATGRKVLDLHPGANDVRAPAPGVYFVREQGSRGRGSQDSMVTKVVVTR